MSARVKKALVIFTKAPRAGESKTRLIPALAAEQAAELQASFLRDTVEQCLRLPDTQLVVAYTPTRAQRQIRDLIPEPVLFIPQGHGNLGERMCQVFGHLFKRGYHSVCLIGSDTPTLPLDYLARACRSLEQNDVVLGPTVDGGYYLIGMRTLHRTLFERIAWSTPQALAQTVERIRQQNLRLASLEKWYDVDTPGDLAFLVEHLQVLIQTCASPLPRATIRTLQKFGLV